MTTGKGQKLMSRRLVWIQNGAPWTEEEDSLLAKYQVRFWTWS